MHLWCLLTNKVEQELAPEKDSNDIFEE